MKIKFTLLFIIILAIALGTGCKQEVPEQCPVYWETETPDAVGFYPLNVTNGKLNIRNLINNGYSMYSAGMGVSNKEVAIHQSNHSQTPYIGKWTIYIDSMNVVDNSGFAEIAFYNSANAAGIRFYKDSIASIIPGYQGQPAVNFSMPWAGSATHMVSELWLMPNYELGIKVIIDGDTLSGLMPHFNEDNISVSISVRKPAIPGQSKVIVDRVTATYDSQMVFDDKFDCNTIYH